MLFEMPKYHHPDFTKPEFVNAPDVKTGIAEQDLPRVCEKGFTGKNGRTGKNSTGLGLYLCKKLCEKMGHRLEIVSKEGKGCMVIIRFPKGSMTDELF